MSRARSRTLVVSAALVLAVLGPPPTSGAQAENCSVENPRTGETFSALQLAVDAAGPSDVLVIEGLCAGSTLITKPLRLRGRATADSPSPTLDGSDAEQVLRVRGRAGLVLRDITVSHGTGGLGGAIRLGREGRLSLRGSTAVTNSDAEHGGGIFGFDAVVRLYDTSSVAGNEATYSGGGISGGTVIVNDDAIVVNNVARRGGGISSTGDVVLNDSARVTGNLTVPDTGGANGGGGIAAKRVTLNDGASVSGNISEGGGAKGGGIFAWGAVRMRDSASVFSNTADEGGGIAVYNRGVTLRGSSRVSGNEATSSGGGIVTLWASGVLPPIWLYGTSSVVENTAAAGGGISTEGSVYACSDEVAISPNDPDDPPVVVPCP